MSAIVEGGVSSLLEHLSLELVYHILRFASAESRKIALACARVSSGVRSSTASELYHTVIIRCPAQINGFVRLLLQGGEHEGPKVRASIKPGMHVRNLVITHHIPTPSSTPSSFPPSSHPPSPSVLQALLTKDPLATIFEQCINVSRAVLQSSFLHSSLVAGDPVNKIRWLTGGELVVQGPMLPSDWDAHVDAIVGGKAEATEAENLADIRDTSVLSFTTHLTFLDPLSSPHISARALAQLLQLMHIAVWMQPPHHSPSWQANIPFADILPLLSSPSLIMVVVLLKNSPNTYFLSACDRREMFVGGIRESRDQRRQERLDHWIDSARKIDQRVYVLESMNRPSGDLLDGWRNYRKEGVWDRAALEREQRDLRSAGIVDNA